MLKKIHTFREMDNTQYRRRSLNVIVMYTAVSWHDFYDSIKPTIFRLATCTWNGENVPVIIYIIINLALTCIYNVNLWCLELRESRFHHLTSTTVLWTSDTWWNNHGQIYNVAYLANSNSTGGKLRWQPHLSWYWFPGCNCTFLFFILNT